MRGGAGDGTLVVVTDLIDTTEMYLRTIYDLEEEGIPPLRARIAERLGHSGPTVSQTVARMERDGLLHVANSRRIELTPEGRLLATRVMRKHRLAERLLVDVVGLELEYVHDEACRWEHVMSERVERKILELIVDKGLSPYGNPLPGLDELGWGEAPEGFRDGVQSLVEVAGSESLRVVVRRIGEPAQADAESLAVLTSVGLSPGVALDVRADGDRVHAAVADRPDDAVSLPEDIASHVFVSVTGQQA